MHVKCPFTRNFIISQAPGKMNCCEDAFGCLVWPSGRKIFIIFPLACKTSSKWTCNTHANCLYLLYFFDNKKFPIRCKWTNQTGKIAHYMNFVSTWNLGQRWTLFQPGKLSSKPATCTSPVSNKHLAKSHLSQCSLTSLLAVSRVENQRNILYYYTSDSL